MARRRSSWQGQPKGLADANRRRTQEALARQEEAKKRAEGIHVPGWNEALHPRHPAGSPQGGQFAPGDRIKGTSLFSNRDKIEGEVVEVLDSGIVVKEDDGRERVVRPETAEHVGTSGLSSSGATIRGVRNPQAPSRPRGPLNRRRVTPGSLIASTKWSPDQKAKIEKVLSEFKAGTLEDGNGGKVTNKKQALAIALSEAKSLTASGRKRFEERKHKRRRKGQRGGGQFTAKAAVEAAKGIALWMSPTTDEERALIERARFERPALRPGVGYVAAGTWDESKHPRHDEGSPQGGQFSAKDAVEKADSGADRPPGDDDFEMDEESQDLENRALKYVEQGYQPTDGEPGEWITLTNSETGEEITLTVGEEYDGEFDEGARGAQEDDGEVDPYATDYDEAGGNAVQNPQDIGYVGGPVEKLSDEELFRQIDRAEASPATTSFQERLIDLKREADRRIRRQHGGETASAALTASAAGLAPMVPPKSWFDKPKLEGPTGMTVTADGQVYGHAALWGTCHTGMSGVCRTPPRSESGYRFFHLGEIDTDGGPVHVGRVSMDTGHAPLTASRDGAVRHYDDTGTGIAHVRAYEDDHGIVLAGALVPDAPAEKARRFKGATVSGDWRSIQGKLELVGMLAVNVPGFPVPRAMAASLMVEDEPHTMALVAAGVYRDDDEDKRKLKALTARALGGVDGLAAAAGYKSKARRRMGVTAANRPFDEAKHPRDPGGEGGGRWVAKGTTESTAKLPGSRANPHKDFKPSDEQIADQITGEIIDSREDLEFTMVQAEQGKANIFDVREAYQRFELALLTRAEDVDKLAASAFRALYAIPDPAPPV